ncbi:NAD(P)H-binding protein [Pseudomonas sp. MAFF212427]|uniref:NAD(P)H-binding protein n=1 Tax=Pseudomonas brassicae TaxID=2708063 RepID=A0A6B3NTV2_9PSED|nr:NAD(P)H-binding protein [Pseudomonas brassicae]
MSKLCLVTGANGHLGNTLVRTLLRQGYRVRAGVRDVRNLAPFAGLDCEVVYAEALDQAAMFKALQGVDVLFQVAAVFRHWARHPQQQIIAPNVQGTRCVLAAAARAGVQRLHLGQFESGLLRPANQLHHGQVMGRVNAVAAAALRRLEDRLGGQPVS